MTKTAIILDCFKDVHDNFSKSNSPDLPTIASTAQYWTNIYKFIYKLQTMQIYTEFDFILSINNHHINVVAVHF